MTLAVAFSDLNRKVKLLGQNIDNLMWAVVHGQPEGGLNHALVDQLDMNVNDWLGIAKALQEATLMGVKASKSQADLTAVRQALVQSQTQYNELLHQFYATTLTYLPELQEGAELFDDEDVRQSALSWAKGVLDGYFQCPSSLQDVGQSLLNCWQELAERMNLLSVSVQANNCVRESYVIQQEWNT